MMMKDGMSEGEGGCLIDEEKGGVLAFSVSSLFLYTFLPFHSHAIRYTLRYV